MGNFFLPENILLDTNGDPISSGRIFFYDAGTSDKITTYTTRDMDTPHANPVVADSAGRFNDIWIPEGTDYKVVVAAAGADDPPSSPIYTWDDQSVLVTNPVAGTTAVATVNSIARTPLQYGAIGDGASDETSAVQSAIDDTNYTVDLCGKTYLCDSQLTWPANRRIINGTLDFTNYTGSACIATSGGALGSALNLTANADVGDVSVEMDSGDAATLTAGDWVQITSTGDWYNTVNAAETIRVKSVSGTTVTFYRQLIFSYTTANTATVKKLTTVTNLKLEDVNVVMAHTSTQYGVNAAFAEDISFVNCKFTGFDTGGILFGTAINASVDGCVFNDGQAAASGVMTYLSSTNVNVDNCSFNGVDYPVYIGNNSTSGCCTNINVTNCNANDCLRGAFVGAAVFVNVHDNNFICSSDNNSYGVYMTSPYGSVRGNTIRHAQNTGIYYEFNQSVSFATPADGDPVSTTATPWMHCSGNKISLSAGYGIYVAASSSTVDCYGLNINDNSISGLDSLNAIFVYAQNANIEGVTVNGNAIEGCFNGIALDGQGNQIRGITVSGNHLYRSASTGTAIEVKGDALGDVRDISIVGNSVDNFSIGVALLNSTHATVSGCTFRGLGYAAVNLDNNAAETIAEYYAITGNVVDTSSNYAFIFNFSGSIENMNISDNVVSDCSAETILISPAAGETLKFITIADNQFLRNGDKPISMTVDTLGNIQLLSITGNLFEASTLPVTLTDVAGLSVANNIFRDCTAGSLNLDDCDVVSIVGNQFEGQAAAGSFVIDIDNSDVAFTTASGYTINGNTITNNAGGAIDINNGAVNIKELSVVGNTLDAGGAEAFKLTTTTGTIVGANISNNVVTACTQFIDLVTGADGSDIAISGNSAYSASTTLDLISIAPSAAEYLSNVTISNNVLRGGDKGIYAIECKYLTISNNSLSGGDNHGIEVAVSATGTLIWQNIVGNTVSVAGSYSGILMTVASGGSISGATITGNAVFSGGDGIEVAVAGVAQGVNDLSISGNSIAAAADGITCNLCRGLGITSNEIDSSSDGIYVVDSECAGIASNNIKEVGAHGIYFHDTVGGNDTISISGNAVRGFGGHGIYMLMDDPAVAARGWSVTGNHIDGTGNVDAGNSGIAIATDYDMSDISVLGNHIVMPDSSDNGQPCINIWTRVASITLDHVFVIGNTCINGGTTIQAVLNVAETAAQNATCNDCGVFGNCVSGGHTSIRFSFNTYARACAGGNYLINNTTDVGGTWTSAASSATAADLPSLTA